MKPRLPGRANEKDVVLIKQVLKEFPNNKTEFKIGSGYYFWRAHFNPRYVLCSDCTGVFEAKFRGDRKGGKTEITEFTFSKDKFQELCKSFLKNEFWVKIKEKSPLPDTPYSSVNFQMGDLKVVNRLFHGSKEYGYSDFRNLCQKTFEEGENKKKKVVFPPGMIPSPKEETITDTLKRIVKKNGNTMVISNLQKFFELERKEKWDKKKHGTLSNYIKKNRETFNFVRAKPGFHKVSLKM